MKIERIELRHIKMPLVAPFTTSMGTDLDVEHIIIRVDAEGLTGWGECVAEAAPFYSGETVTTAWHVLQDFLLPAVLGKKLSGIDQANDFMARVRGHRMAKAGLEAALWDVFAKSRNASLATMLNGTKHTVAVGISIGMQPTVAELIRRVEAFRAEGYAQVKIKIAPGNDIETVKALRREFPHIPLQVDANAAYKLSDIALLKKLDDYSLRLIEQPLHHEDLLDHAELQRQIATTVALDESICSLHTARAACALKSCRAMNIKPGRVGGLSEAVRIHALCAAHHIPVWHGGMLETGIGRAANLALASLENFTLPADIYADGRHYSEDIVESPCTLNADSTLNVPTGPGIGVQVRLARLEQVTATREVFC